MIAWITFHAAKRYLVLEDRICDFCFPGTNSPGPAGCWRSWGWSGTDRAERLRGALRVGRYRREKVRDMRKRRPAGDVSRRPFSCLFISADAFRRTSATGIRCGFGFWGGSK